MGAAGDLGFGIDVSIGNVHVMYMYAHVCWCENVGSLCFGSFGIVLKNFMISTFVYNVCLCPLSFYLLQTLSGF